MLTDNRIERRRSAAKLSRPRSSLTTGTDKKEEQQVGKVLWTRKGVSATVVTAGHCTYAELTSRSGHALASC